MILPELMPSELDLLEPLQRLRQDLGNTRGGSPHEQAKAYLRWAAEARRMVLSQTTAFDWVNAAIARLFGALQLPNDSRTIADLASAETENALARLDQLIESLGDRRDRWQQASLLICDTNVFLHHIDPIECIDYHSMIEGPRDNLILVVPIVVIDELDNAQRSHKDVVRAKARTTLRQIMSAIEDHLDGDLRRDGRQRVTIEVVLDAQGHNRLARADDELVDRALLIQYVTQQTVTLATFDKGLVLRARANKLQTHELID